MPWNMTDVKQHTAFVSLLEEFFIRLPDSTHIFDRSSVPCFSFDNPLPRWKAGKEVYKAFTWPPSGPSTVPSSAFTERFS